MYRSFAIFAAMAAFMAWPTFAIEDPTRPPNVVPQASEKVAVSLPTLNSILLGPDRRLAVIGGEPVREGQTLKGFKVVKIQSTQVQLRNRAGRLLTLTLRSDKIKKDIK